MHTSTVSNSGLITLFYSRKELRTWNGHNTDVAIIFMITIIISLNTSVGTINFPRTGTKQGQVQLMLLHFRVRVCIELPTISV